MELLIKHGTWILVPIGLVLSFVYLHILPKVYPFLLARRRDEQSGRQPVSSAMAKRSSSARRPAMFRTVATERRP